MQTVSHGLIAMFNHPEFPDLFKPALGFLILKATQPARNLPSFVGFKTVQGTWLTREIDRFPPCAN